MEFLSYDFSNSNVNIIHSLKMYMMMSPITILDIDGSSFYMEYLVLELKKNLWKDIHICILVLSF